MSLTLEQLMELLGITKKEASVLRLVDGVVPSIAYVDLGANGTGENGYLVKKGRTLMTTPMGTLQKDAQGNYIFATVAKAANPDAVKLSAANKSAVTEAIAAQETQIADLKKVLDESEEDDAITDLPESVKTLLAGMAKGVDIDEPKVDPEHAEPKTEPIAPVAKNADGVGPDPVPAEPGTFAIGELVLTGNLATIAKGMADAAGEGLDEAELIAAIEPMMALQAKHTPNEATTQAMATVTKRMDDKFAALATENAELKAAVMAMGAGGLMGMGIVPDGTQTAPTKKGKGNDAPAFLPCGQDLGKFASGDGPADFSPKG